MGHLDIGTQVDTDAQLVARLRQGDLSAFAQLVDRHRATLLALAAGRLGSREDAEDVAQEAFVQAFFRLHQLREPDSLLPWLRRLTDRLALSRLRRRREEPVEPQQLERMRVARRGDEAPATAGEGRAWEVLSLLPPAMRGTVALTFIAGYTCAETASLLGIREGTVKSRLSRARARLKEALTMTEEEMHEAEPTAEFTDQTVARLLREASRLLAAGQTERAGARAEEVLGMQARAGFDAGGDPEQLHFGPEAARIAGLSYRERRRKDCEANAAQYGYRLEDLDWELADVDVLCETLGKPAGKGGDVWGIPVSRERIVLYDARDVCRRLRCSPQTLHGWVQRGCPALRCWPYVRFDWARVKQWLAESGTKDWPRERDHDLDRPIRVIFRDIQRGELTPAQAEEILDALDM